MADPENQPEQQKAAPEKQIIGNKSLMFWKKFPKFVRKNNSYRRGVHGSWRTPQSQCRHDDVMPIFF